MDREINDVKEIKEIFANMNPGDPAVIVRLNMAKKNSIGVPMVKRKTFLENIHMDKLKKSIVGIALTAAVVVGAYGTVKNVSDKVNDPYNMNNLSREIGMIVSDEEEHISIVNQNTRFNGNVSYYQHDKIAKDLLKLDNELFEYAFCTVCNDMGQNINNKVGINGKSNIDSVIYYLKLISSSDGGSFNPFIDSLFEDIDTLNDFLIKKGYVNENGEASLDVFKEVCNQDAKVLYDIVQTKIESKKTRLS